MEKLRHKSTELAKVIKQVVSRAKNSLETTRLTFFQKCENPDVISEASLVGIQ